MMGADKGKLGLPPLARFVSSQTKRAHRISPHLLHNFFVSQCIRKYQVTNRTNIHQIIQTSPPKPGIQSRAPSSSRASAFSPWLSQQEAGPSSTQQPASSISSFGRGCAADPSPKPTSVLKLALGMSEGVPKLHHARDGG